MDRQTRIGSTLLLLALCAYSAGALWDSIWNPPDVEYQAHLDHYDRQRFESVRPYLPSTGIIGYQEDAPPFADDIGVVNRFTQYVLTPIVLDGRAAGPMILVNGHPEAVPHVGKHGRKATLVHDAGNGVRLYRVEGP